MRPADVARYTIHNAYAAAAAVCSKRRAADRYFRFPVTKQEISRRNLCEFSDVLIAPGPSSPILRSLHRWPCLTHIAAHRPWSTRDATPRRWTPWIGLSGKCLPTTLCLFLLLLSETSVTKPGDDYVHALELPFFSRYLTL